MVCASASPPATSTPRRKRASSTDALFRSQKVKWGGVAGKHSPYTVVGEVSGKYALLSLLDEGAPIADIGVCLHSRAAHGLFARLVAPAADYLPDVEQPREAPWCAVLCYAPEDALPPWFDAWTKTLAVALVGRRGW